MGIHFANINFKGLNKEHILEEDDTLKFIVTANAEFIVKAQENEKFRDILSSNFTTFDGQIPYYIAKKQNPKRKIEKLSGSDIIFEFCLMAKEKDKKVFLLGGYEKSNKLAVERIKNEYGIQIDGYSPPYKTYPFENSHNKKIINKLNIYKPDILFVGFGALKQELWIDENKDHLKNIGIKWVIGSGGTFEFVSGEIKRAPKFIQNIGLEGVWRLINEPKWFRLKRLIESIKILKYI